MSFLVDDGDQQATLELALAFIDACDADAADAHTSATDSNSSSSGDELWTERESDDPTSLRVVIRKAPSALAPPPPFSWGGHVQALSSAALLFSEPNPSSHGGLSSSLDTVTPTPMAKPKTARAASLKKHRDRKKAEMQSLRDQVAALEAQLAHLRLVARPQLKPCDTSQPLPLAVLPFLLDARSQLQEAAAAGMSWADIAAAQASERFRSEALNQTLRDALQRQAQMSDAVRGVLGSSEALSEDMASLLGLQKHESLNTLGAAPQTVLMQQLYANLQQMYGATASVIGPQSEADWTGAASCTTREKERDALGSKCIEIRTTSQLFCSFAEVGRLMWQRTIRMQSSSSPNDPSEYMMEKRLVTGSSFMKTFRIPLETPSVAHTADLVGTSYMHKFDEPGRHLCLWTSTISLPALGAEFREQGWILAAPCRQPPGSVDASDTGPSTVLKMCYQVSHVSDGLEASTAQSRAVADAVLKLLSRRTREHLQIMQNTLLDEYLPFQRPPRASQP